MSGEIEKVDLIGINRQGIREDPVHHGYAFLPFKPSGIPDPRWDEFFKHKYAICGHSKKRDLVEKEQKQQEQKGKEKINRLKEQADKIKL